MRHLAAPYGTVWHRATGIPFFFHSTGIVEFCCQAPSVFRPSTHCICLHCGVPRVCRRPTDSGALLQHLQMCCLSTCLRVWLCCCRVQMCSATGRMRFIGCQVVLSVVLLTDHGNTDKGTTSVCTKLAGFIQKKNWVSGRTGPHGACTAQSASPWGDWTGTGAEWRWHNPPRPTERDIGCLGRPSPPQQTPPTPLARLRRQQALHLPNRPHLDGLPDLCVLLLRPAAVDHGTGEELIGSTPIPPLSSHELRLAFDRLPAEELTDWVGPPPWQDSPMAPARASFPSPFPPS